MKRGADRQISKDDDPDDENRAYDTKQEVQTGLQMAKESDLARREIKGLPKRKNPLAQAGPSPVTSATVCPNRAAFSSSPLTASAPLPASCRTKIRLFFGFWRNQRCDNPVHVRTLSSLLANHRSQQRRPGLRHQPSQNLRPTQPRNLCPSLVLLQPRAQSQAVPSSDSPKPDASGDTDEVALKYYTSLRGLNTSFLSAVSKAIDSDPFADVVDLLEQYKKHRISVQTEYDGKSSQSTSRSCSECSYPATSTSAAMPVPPSSFAGFPAMSTTASSTSPAPGTGFTPSPAASAIGSSSFGFPSVPPASSDTKPSAASSSPFGFSFGTSTAASTTSSASPFGSSQPSSGTSLFGSPPKSSTLFGSDSKSSTAEGNEKEKDKPASNAFGSAPFTLSIPPGTKLFGDTASSSNSSSSIFGAKSTEKDKEKEKDTSSPPSSVFGATTFGSPAKPSSSPFSGFGSAASTATPAQFVFGVAAGAAGEGTPSPKAGSVGFSFGSPSRGSSQTAAPAAPSSGGGLGFSFSSAPPASSGATGTSTPASTNLEVPSRADTPATDGTQEDGLARTLSPCLPNGEADAEGEGEEDEETTYTVKAKVYKFTMDNEGAPSWAEMGIGMLRLKKHKVTNARRVILRSSTTGKIIINFRIYAGLQPKRNAKAVAFTGHITSPDKETQTVQYRLRVGTEATATELAEAIEREVRLVQAEAS
ncbi:hypothetical protein EDB83DRAFT_2309457 [Lactarius deliciosus]|nr:hypothetical protein EDB83DRAFT_2309457 [Lactarius deliciosus]